MLISVFGLFHLTGCEKFIHTDMSSGELAAEGVFRDSINAEAAVIGVYLAVNSGGIYSVMGGGMTVLTGLTADELIPVNATNVYREYFENHIAINNGVNAGTWTQAYQQLYLANACLEGLEKAEAISEMKRRQLIGEVLQIRAATYFYLIQLYGDVPLILTTDYRINQHVSRTPVEEIYQQIIVDLQLAQQYLDGIKHQVLRAGYYSASGLLAKVYLMQGKYEEAEREAGKVISSGLFSLTENPEDVFAADSKEAIWSWVTNDHSLTSIQTSEGFTLVPSSTAILPSYQVADRVKILFDETDKRYDAWFGHNVVNGESYYYLRKYQVSRPGPGTRSENYIILRLAEQYLIRAESRMRTGEGQGGLDDLNEIRQRAGLDRLESVYSVDQLVEMVLLERRRELFCEWGSRWMDLKRFGILNDEMQQSKEWWNEWSSLFPIPSTELDRNPYLVQNPGY